ncbi:hypothetical protein BPY_20440 [Bifidobacterium psychraerophilum]
MYSSIGVALLQSVAADAFTRAKLSTESGMVFSNVVASVGRAVAEIVGVAAAEVWLCDGEELAPSEDFTAHRGHTNALSNTRMITAAIAPTTMASLR